MTDPTDWNRKDSPWAVGAREERAKIMAFGREYARRVVDTENKLAMNGSYVSASETANWRMGIEHFLLTIERGEHDAR